LPAEKNVLHLLNSILAAQTISIISWNNCISNVLGSTARFQGRHSSDFRSDHINNMKRTGLSECHLMRIYALMFLRRSLGPCKASFGVVGGWVGATHWVVWGLFDFFL
jgi:hypothetical protein